MEEIKIKVKTKDLLPLHFFSRLQGDLKILTNANYEKLKSEILSEGFCFAIHVWENKDDAKIYTLDGNQRIETLTRMKDEGYQIPQLPVVFIEAENINEAKKILLGGASQYGEFNQKGAEDFISTIEGVDIDYLNKNLALNNIDYENIEFNKEEEKVIDVQGHQRTLSTYVEGEDDIPEIKESKVKLGNIFQLGNHRLMCGDSTSIDAVENLMDGQKADMVFTDPPYNQETEGGTVGMIGSALRKQSKEIEHMCDFEPDNFLKILPIVFKKNTLNALVFCNKDLVVDYLKWSKENDYAYNILFWKKPTAIPIGGSYRPDVEYLLVFRKSGIFNGNIEGLSYSKCLEFNREKDKIHPTMKPVEMIENQLKICSNNNSIVMDFFGGSGSTLIACEKTNRKCFMMELDPHYCSVIIERWQKFTEQQAMRINPDGSTILYDDIKQTILRHSEL